MIGRNGRRASVLAAAFFLSSSYLRAESGAWLNAPAGFSLAALRGKAVLLDFWTYSRVDCVRAIPELERLQAEHPGELAIVGIHAPESDAQKRPERLRQAVLREDVTFPTLNDAEHKTWAAYGVTACPAFVLLDPEGRAAARFDGPRRFEEIERRVDELITQAKESLDGKPIDAPLERDERAGSILSYPGKVAVDQAGRRVFVSDTGHNRVIVADFSGRARSVIGTGQDGVSDGAFETAAFRHPQGLALVGDDLYIADEGNDRVRQADLKRGRVRTMRQTFDMSSPWDLAFVNDRLFIAAAGFHNLMMLNTHAGTLSLYAGKGREGSQDGALTAASFAQPSALASGEGRLFIADSESGALRSVDLADPEVRTLVSPGLRRPLGLAYAAGALYVADSDDGQIKRLDLKTKAFSIIAGGFDEPGGLAAFEGGLLVADTGHHRLVRLSLDGKSRSDFVLKGLQPPPPAPPTMPMPAPRTVALPQAQVRSGRTVRLLLSLALPKGYRLHPLAPFYYGVLETSGPVEFDLKSRKGLLREPRFPIPVEFKASEGAGEALLNAAFYYCRDDGKGLCRAKSIIVRVPIAASAQAGSSSVQVPISAD